MCALERKNWLFGQKYIYIFSCCSILKGEQVEPTGLGVSRKVIKQLNLEFENWTCDQFELNMRNYEEL